MPETRDETKIEGDVEAMKAKLGAVKSGLAILKDEIKGKNILEEDRRGPRL